MRIIRIQQVDIWTIIVAGLCGLTIFETQQIKIVNTPIDNK